MEYVLVGGRVLTHAAPSSSNAEFTDAALDVRVVDGRIAELGRGLTAKQTISVAGLWVLPGLVDLAAQLGEPGLEYREDLATGTHAAAAGGYTTVCALPSTQPPNDQRSITEVVVRRARDVGRVNVHPIGAITRGREGAQLADIADLKAGGAVALSDDGRAIADAGVMRRALEYARTFGLPVIADAVDAAIAEGGAMHEGEVATRLGLRSQPGCAESALVARDLELVAWTGARYHVGRATTARTVELIADARRRGLPVTAAATAAHLTWLDADCASYDPAYKVMPPLRVAADRDALITALENGTIDAIVSDHRPLSRSEKELEFEAALPGMSSLETTLSLVLALVRDGRLSLRRAVALLTSGPAAAFGLPGGSLSVGAAADIAIIDPSRSYIVDSMASRSRNTPLLGQGLIGRCVLTIVNGASVYDLDGRLAPNDEVMKS